MAAETWCLVLAVTCSWNKKRIICKPFQASFRYWVCTWRCMILTEVALLTHPPKAWAWVVFQELGRIGPKTLLPFASPSCNRQCNIENDKFRIRNGACSCGPGWNHNHSLWEDENWPLGWREDRRVVEEGWEGKVVVIKLVPSFYSETFWLRSTFGNRLSALETV